MRGDRATEKSKTPTTVEALLVWAIRNEQADKACEAFTKASPDDFTGRISADGCYALLSRQQLGARIDGGGAGAAAISRDCHPDAEAVYWEIMNVPAPWCFELLRCARHDEPPDWGERFKEGVLVEPDTVYKAGRWVPRLRTAGVDSRPYCPIRFAKVHDQLFGARNHYAQWFSLLEHIGGAFTATPERLTCWRIVGAGSQREPWVKTETQISS